MRLLIVGGTGFLGGAAARAGVEAGHAVTVMTRSGHNVTAGAKTLIADRTEDLPDLRGQFDTVIDTCGYAPDMVTQLAAAVGDVHYVFVSSISVYADLSRPGMDETADAPHATADDLEVAANVPREQRGEATLYGAAYGRLKRSCEDAAVAAFGERATLIRLGLIIGPDDYTDRFTWWVRRLDGGRILPVSAPPERLIQLIDVEDAAAFMLRQAETGIGGVFNLTGDPIPFSTMIEEIVAQTDHPIDLRWAPLDRFTELGVEPWIDLPLIVPDKPSVKHMLNVSIAKAKEAGLECRPLNNTISRVLSWDRDQRSVVLKCGLSEAQEVQLLNAIDKPRN